MTSRNPEVYVDALQDEISYAASPRATLALDRCARAHAWLAGRDFVGPDDVQEIAHCVLRHRILLTFEAEAQGYTSDKVIDTLLSLVAVP
jgi:MoxR-like ATPase